MDESLDRSLENFAVIVTGATIWADQLFRIS